ncbi:hypothetical protein [Streptomyces cavernae]|uniref:hypothetical protein n=1 Tax=Streptomyces cavernae TaxID=2259034 RepID=UPI000FEBC64F|nr:hypothetical protein [Streptomyces cavernae]
MTRATENRIDTAATVVALTTEATELETRVNELRQEIVDLNKRIEAISDALHQLPAHSSAVSKASVPDEL